jgi:hypothetical protein
MKNKTISLLIFFICFISFYSQEADKNWTIKNNSINIITYESQLDDTQRENYYYWIGLRNSFYYSENSNQLEKLVKYFTPEEETYYKNLYNFSAPGLILTGVVILAFFFYLVKRFLLKGCQGPKNVEQSYRYTTYFLIGFGILIGLIFHIFTIYNAAVSK